MLSEAAEIEERERGDVHAATRDLGLALRLRPRDTALASRFRRVAALVARAAPAAAAPAPAPEETFSEGALTDVPPPPEETGEDDDERLAQELTDRLRANPRDHATAMKLAGALELLGRDLDLLALLSARMEEGDAEERREAAPKRRAVLMRLAENARVEGRVSEGELYEMMAASAEE
jgi:hypothetical protein